VWVVTYIARSRSKRPQLPQQLRLAGHRQVLTPPTLHPLDQRPALTLSYRPHFDPGVQQITEIST